jgi:hypothetical protein
MSLNNAANRYSDLAGLEETRAGRAQRLQLAVAAIEESVRIRRDLGLQADLAMSLGTSTLVYRTVAASTADRQGQIIWLGKALACIEEAVERFRGSGVVQYWAQAVMECVISHLVLAERTGELDVDRVLALCQEGEALCGLMEDQERLAFFRQVRQPLGRQD